MILRSISRKRSFPRFTDVQGGSGGLRKKPDEAPANQSQTGIRPVTPLIGITVSSIHPEALMPPTAHLLDDGGKAQRAWRRGAVWPRPLVHALGGFSALAVHWMIQAPLPGVKFPPVLGGPGRGFFVLS